MRYGVRRLVAAMVLASRGKRRQVDALQKSRDCSSAPDEGGTSGDSHFQLHSHLSGAIGTASHKGGGQQLLGAFSTPSGSERVKSNIRTDPVATAPGTEPRANFGHEPNVSRSSTTATNSIEIRSPTNLSSDFALKAHLGHGGSSVRYAPAPPDRCRSRLAQDLTPVSRETPVRRFCPQSGFTACCKALGFAVNK